MLAAPLSSADWRVAGMTYNKYAGLCADMLRAALKEPAKSKAKLSETVYFRSALWENGAPTKQGAFVGCLGVGLLCLWCMLNSLNQERCFVPKLIIRCSCSLQ